ncbi:hypothetical protein L1049_025970 [Liquidambar formosana]|uniref:Serine carboxypeptidase-like 2 n=1 Tax=Liquidambar formosana TaxID=63359 RepID=A0AAP0R8S2_LIQFO
MYFFWSASRIFIFLVDFKLCSHLAVSHSTVGLLPGFEGPLPFELETGYVGVDESEDVQLFYYFVKSETNPKEDPVLLWLTGGPGCSTLSALLYEIGPLNFGIAEYNGSLPTLVLNPNSWTKVSSIIFVDLPVGTGFSYAKTPLAFQSGDIKASHQTYEFLRKWLMNHPEFLSNPVYVGGDSYVGITLPPVVQLISNGNEEGIQPFVNLKGYILGNPITLPTLEQNSTIPFAHRMGLISDELYESLKRDCGGDYQNIDPSNTECLRDLQDYIECISGIQTAQILEPLCSFFATPKLPDQISGERRLQDENSRGLHDLEPTGCRSYGYLLSHYWVNDDSVQEALHIKKGSIGEWQRCTFGLQYTAFEIKSSFEYHVNLSTKGYRALIYSGDHDMIVPFFATQAWIKSLNYSIVDDWRSWIVQGQVAGWVPNLNLGASGGGHTAPEYKPEECYAMFKRWISEEPL